MSNPMTVDWYFDPISPFAYLQAEQLTTWLPANNIRARPVVLGALLSHHETRGPAEIRLKRVQTYRSALARAELLDIPFRFPPAHPFDPLPLLRLCVAAGAGFHAAREVLRFVWRDGRQASDAESFSELARRLGVPDAQAAIVQSDVKLRLRSATDEAIRLGVFGVPSLHIGDEIFWGEDASAMARRAWESGPAWLAAGEWGRAMSLPVGVQRRT